MMTRTDPSTITPPRTVSPDMRRRIWGEARVRFWFILAALLLIAGVAISLSGIGRWVREVDLARHGTVVRATITQSGGGLSHHLIDEDAEWDVTFTLNGHKYTETGYPPAAYKAYYNGQTIPLRVDPKDPSHWTNQAQPPSVMRELAGLGLLLPVVIFCAAAGVIRGRRLMRACASGPVHRATILKINQSALAPRSYAVRCAVTDGSSRRIYSIFVPRNFAPQPGGELSIVTPAAGSTLAFALLPADSVNP